jgi:putative flippase GtrA
MRYTLIGVICAILNNLMIIVGDRYGVHYLTMTIAAFAVVTPLAYLMHACFTFREPGSLRGFLLFAAGLTTAFPVFFLSMAILCTGFRVPVIVATPITTVVLYVWNYASAHWTIRGRRY